MGIRSQNNTNPIAAYLDVFSSTGTDAMSAGGGGGNTGAPTGLTATGGIISDYTTCLLYTSPSPRDQRGSRMPSSA